MNEIRLTLEETCHQEYTFSRVKANSRSEGCKRYTWAWGYCSGKLQTEPVVCFSLRRSPGNVKELVRHMHFQRILNSHIARLSWKGHWCSFINFPSRTSYLAMKNEAQGRTSVLKKPSSWHGGGGLHCGSAVKTIFQPTVLRTRGKKKSRLYMYFENNHFTSQR